MLKHIKNERVKNMVFKCKMCGGDIEVVQENNIAKCQYCKSTMTLPNLENEKIANLYNRANDYRIANEFDKAYGVYETILEIDNTQVEAHWGLLLCKYGVEYVDDPKTNTKIPTCHRTITTSILKDNEFKIIKSNSFGEALAIYQKEAENIDQIQKSILEISAKEEPYDIFICYKETDNEGNRTNDSVIAQDIYDKLVDKGYKVFFARITLENKLGSEYEPYIYSALNSAKVMLAVGTSEEHYNAVWVKNEWSRFLEMMKTDKRKVLIPVYSKVEAYKIPEEFAMFQAQSMDKIGAMQDLVHGIDKLIADSKKKNIADEDVDKIRQAMDEATNLGNGQYEVVIMKEKLPTWYYVLILLLASGIGFLKLVLEYSAGYFITNNANYDIARMFYISPVLPILYFAPVIVLAVGTLLKFLGRKRYRLGKYVILAAIIFEILSCSSIMSYGYVPYGFLLNKIHTIVATFMFAAMGILLLINPKWHIDSSSKVIMNKENREKRQEANNKILKEFKEKEEKIISKKAYIIAGIIAIILAAYGVYRISPINNSVAKNENVDQLLVKEETTINNRPDGYYRYPCGYALENDYLEILEVVRDENGIVESYRVKNGKNAAGYIDAGNVKMIYSVNSEFYGKTQSNDRNEKVLQVMIINDSLRIRTESNTWNGKEIGKVYKGEIYTVLEEKKGSTYNSSNITWYKIKTTFGVTGYIAERETNDSKELYVRRLEPQK